MKRFVNVAMTILTTAIVMGLQGCPPLSIEIAVEESAELSISLLGCTEEMQPTITLIGETLSWDENATTFGKSGETDLCTFRVLFTPTLPSLYRLRVSSLHADGGSEAAAEAFAQASLPPVLDASTILNIVIEGGPDEDRAVVELEIESKIVGLSP